MRPTLFPLVALLAAAPLAAQTPAPAAPPAAAPAPVKLTAEQEAKMAALGKTYTRWFLGGQADSLATAFDAEMLTKVQGVGGITEMMGQIADRAGFQTKVIAEKMTYRNGKPQYWHEAEFSELAGESLVIRWIFSPEGKIIGAGINPKSAAPKPDGL
ncbi:MAG: hypothetical protein SFU84_14120 [Gemmatimonadales bacterium]|nr:hypothetical protein [Gemmatimonadales bacterium]